MRLTFSVDIPIKDPESIIDLPKLRENSDLSYVMLDDEGNPRPEADALNYRALSDQTRMLANQLRAKGPQIRDQIRKMKESHPAGLTYDHQFPEGFGLRYPQHLQEYQRAQTRFNMLYNETFTLADHVDDYLNDAMDIGETALRLLEAVLSEFWKNEEKLSEMTAETHRFQEECQKKMASQAADFEDFMAKMKERVTSLSLICDEKDVVIAEAQDINATLTAEKLELQQKLTKLQYQMDTKFRSSEELSGYVNTLLKAKRDLTAQLEARTKEVADLQYRLEVREEENRIALQRNKDRFYADLERERRRFEGEIFKLKDVIAQKQPGV